MDKLKMHSADLTERNIEQLAELFPTVITESRDAEGRVVRAVDFDLLRQELSDHVVEGPRERYQLDWPGKREALFAANAPIAKTLRPVREASIDFDNTKNLFIEGDNLDALKLLQESYLGKVKLIYIDPPYNTGNDFIYNDDFSQTSAEFLEKSGQVDEEGNRLVANTESNGRFHSDWLSMMYPRLKLARNLLRDDGVMTVSINDAEAPRLRQMLDELFGEKNFLAQLVWMKGKEGGNDPNSGFGQHHEYVLVYGRQSVAAAASIRLDEKDTTRHRAALPEQNLAVEGDTIYREGEPFQLINLSKQKDYTVAVQLKDGSTLEWPSYAPQTTVDEYQKIGKIFVGAKGVPYVKSFLADEADGTKPSTLVSGEWGTTKAGGIALREIFGSDRPFSYPKPPRLIGRLMSITGVERNDIVLDFFAGSGSTAQAVLEANKSDGGHRRFVVVQMPEDLDEALKATSGKARQTIQNAITLCDQIGASRTVAAVSRERIRRVHYKLGEAMSAGAPTKSQGFRVLHIDSASFAHTSLVPDEQSQESLLDSVESIKPDRTSEDLVFQVLLDWGLELSVPIAREELAGHEVFDIDGGALLACFDETVSLEVVELIARRQPLRAVFRASGFVTDADRINAEQLFAQYSPATDVKAI